MDWRVISLIIIFALILPQSVRSSDASRLSLPKTEVVIPLLKSLSITNTSEKSVLKQIQLILGDNCVTNIHGPGVAVEEVNYTLQDDSFIHVVFLEGKLLKMTLEVSGPRVLEILYPAPE
jgi:hypothetical protein